MNMLMQLLMDFVVHLQHFTECHAVDTPTYAEIIFFNLAALQYKAFQCCHLCIATCMDGLNFGINVVPQLY